jgi:hypothetical protein
MLKLAGGGSREETDLTEFLDQAEAYRTGGDVADSVFKVLNLMVSTHPFHVLRAAELREWIETGGYDRILRGEYRRREEGHGSYAEDLAAAARAYTEEAKSALGQVGDAVRRMRDTFAGGGGHA